MKKIMIMAMMAVAASTAFAGDSPALKSILKAKTYAEAESLLNSSLGQLASDAEKASAYNKLYQLAFDTFNKQQTIMTENTVAQMNNGKVQPVDSALLYTSIYQAFQAALECNK